MAVATSELIKWLDTLEDEAALRREESGLKDATVNLRFLKNQTWPDSGGPPSPFRPDWSVGTFKFTANILDQLLKRKTALISDSRPQIDVIDRAGGRRASAEMYKTTVAALWDEGNFDQSATRELIRASAIGSTVCLPTWNPSAHYGQGNIEFLMFDPRQVLIDPSVTRAIDLQRYGEYAMVKEVMALNAIREAYGDKGAEVPASSRWSSYGRQAPMNRWRGIASAMQRSYRKAESAFTSATPRQEVRHSWFKDFQRDERLQPKYGLPRIMRYSVDAGGILLKDERLVMNHGEIPLHLFDWGVELENPWGSSEITGLRRIQYTLNRILGQVMDNIILTNRVKVIADSDAVDNPTWQKIAENANGIAIRKRQGRTLNYELPQNAVPAYIVPIIQLLLQAVDIVSGMTEVTRGMAPKGNTSGIAIEGLQIAAQSIIRLEARAFENWLERIFQQVICLIEQYFTSNRLLYLIGPDRKFAEHLFERAKIEETATASGNGHPARRSKGEGWKDFRFKILPTSSLAMTRVQRGVLYSSLFQMGLVSGKEVLRAAEVPTPDIVYEEAQKEAALRAQMGIQPGGQGKPKARMPGTSKRSVGLPTG